MLLISSILLVYLQLAKSDAHLFEYGIAKINAWMQYHKQSSCYGLGIQSGEIAAGMEKGKLDFIVLIIKLRLPQ